jgi:hypothetical protein
MNGRKKKNENIDSEEAEKVKGSTLLSTLCTY